MVRVQYLSAALLAAGIAAISVGGAHAEQQPRNLCSWSSTHWSADGDRLAAVVEARAIVADGRILHYRLRDGVEAEDLVLALTAAIAGDETADGELWVVADTGRAVPPDEMARIAALAEEVRDGPLEEPPPPQAPPGAEAGLTIELLSCTVAEAEGTGDVTILVTGDTTVRNRHPRAAELAEVVAAILDVRHMLEQ